LADNAIVAMAIRAGEAVDPAELIELCSGAKTVFSLATLSCRSLDRVDDCRRIWGDTLEIFQRARDAWTGVRATQKATQKTAQNSADSHDPLLRFYSLQLKRLSELAAARVDLYTISQAERLSYVRQYKADLDEDMLEPHDDPNGEEAKVKEFLSLPI